ncbi:sugar-transfer associated ATP-grasp domain-containing protein [Dethiobacter alkaliphilus]|uniref:sugar-transfer associated ATP-grasp domain-containing protein n=1 Tax=Dethiobacter alkaliphilus TaxID=427926 RepID=UPI002225E28C|nr:sugar-transfer associated ATP-grasp domain-containing protein [Dethiobacter alkaliphilus]MCW3488831.1 acylphosphatase [Dethiobacter alkaliphilus]
MTINLGPNRKRPFMLPNILVFGVIRRPKNAADEIHRAYSIHYWRQCKNTNERMIVFIEFILSPIFIIKEIREWLENLGDQAAHHSNKSVLRQGLEQFYLAYFFSINPMNYYMQEFYKDDGLRRARYFVNENATKHGAYQLLKRYGRYINRTSPAPSLAHKAKFSRFCMDNGIPVVPTLAEVNGNGTIKTYCESIDPTIGLPERDFFCKPNIAKRGSGAEIWFWQGADQYKNHEGKILTSLELKDRIIELACQEGKYIVQPLILPHPKLNPFRKKATPSLRIITYIDGKGKVKVDSARFKFSTDPAAIVDNTFSGALVAPVDTSTGELDYAIDNGLKIPCNRWETHQDNGVPIKGFILPFAKEAIDLAKRGHSIMKSYLVIGWDIAIGSEGPIIIEGNSQPDSDFLQRTYLLPLGKSDLGATVATHLNQALRTLYNGVVGAKKKPGKGTIDLFGGPQVIRLVKCLFFNKSISVKLIINGKVQGVGYRKWLRKQAIGRNVDGWIRNREDGSVEVVLRGRAVDIEDVAKLCWVGTPKSEVTKIRAKRYFKHIKPGFRTKKAKATQVL